jgi:PAS domain S-box-containing protein
MGRPWTFSRWLGAGLVASAVVAIAILATTLLALRAVQVGNEIAVRDLSVDLLELERLRHAFSDRTISLRGYLRARDEPTRERIQTERKRFLAVAERVQVRTRGEPEKDALLKELLQDEREYAAAVGALLRERDEALSQRELEALEAQVGYQRALTEQALERLVRDGESQLVRGIHREMLEDQEALALIITASVLGLLGMLCLAWVLNRHLRPLHHEAKASEQRFRLLVEGVQDYAVYLLDVRGRVESWNPGAERIKGWKEEEVVGRPTSVFYTQEAVAAGEPTKELARAERDGRLRTEGWRVRKDGTRFWAEDIFTALHNERGELRGFAKVVRDITERRRVERTQRLFAEAGRIFNQLLEPDLTVAELARLMVPELADGCVLYLVSPGGRLLPRAITHAAAEKERVLWEVLHRYPPRAEDTRGVAHVVSIGQAERVEHVTEEVLGHMARDREHLELLRRLKLGSTLCVPIGVGEQRLGALMLLSSASERHYTLSDQIFLEELAGRAALALDNARLFQEAQRALELIGVASHDLGNPLNAMQLVLARLRRVDPEREPERVREGLMAAMRHGQRLGRLLYNLLDLSRLSSGKLALEVSRVDLAQLVHEVVERHSEQAAEAGCPLRLDAAQQLEGWWDPLRLERVVANLLSNAMKFGRGRPVEVRVEHAGGKARVTVRDHGVGIPPEAQRRIFERFEREKSAGQHAGFGLGLYIVRQLVEAHGGTIRVQSTPGQGAAFIVDLPRAPSGGVELGADHPPGPH